VAYARKVLAGHESDPEGALALEKVCRRGARCQGTGALSYHRHGCPESVNVRI
jgi:hypothetical protein